MARRDEKKINCKDWKWDQTHFSRVKKELADKAKDVKREGREERERW
jgi:hypothetical protein